MDYQVKMINGSYQVFENGILVNADVTRITFEEFTTHTLHGEVHHITGSCVATIKINGSSIENIPVV